MALLVDGLFIKIATARQPDSTGHSDTKPSYQGEEKVEEKPEVTEEKTTLGEERVEEIKEEVKTES